MLGLGLELAVLDGPLLERPDARDAVVRLPEHALPQQTDSDKQQRRANERDQQLRPNLYRQARDDADERIADRVAAPPERPATPAPGQGLRFQNGRPADHVRDQPLPVDPRHVEVGGRG